MTIRPGRRAVTKKAWIVALTACVLLCPAREANAQVNTENLRKRVKVVGYTFLLEGSLTADTGNTQGITAGGGIGAGLAKAPHLVFAYARADYAEYSGVATVDKTFAHLRYNYTIEDWLWGEAFAQAQSDHFQRLLLRNLFGVGPRFQVVHTGEPHNFDVYLGISYMLERDAIQVAPGASDQAYPVWQRLNMYATVQWQLDSRIIMASTLYVQPVITDYGNVLVLSESLATFKVTKVLSASISGVIRYNSAPPTDVLTTDVEVKNTLSVTF